VAPSIAVVGSINLDLVARCERLPEPGETIQATTFERVPGGKGANQAVAAARLGAAVRMIGCVGNDDFAEEALAGLLAAGVELDIRKVNAPTGVALVVVDESGETQITVVPGANAALEPDHVHVENGEAVLCQLEVPVEAVAAAAERCEGFFCLNAAPARPVPAAVLRRADAVVVNRHEAGGLDPVACDGLMVVTEGAEGAVLLERGQEVARARPPCILAVDGTAAGDAFCAALVVSFLEGRARDEALRRACIAGALAASRPGAQPSLPTAAEVDAALAQ
jgi:ribokinase